MTKGKTLQLLELIVDSLSDDVAHLKSQFDELDHEEQEDETGTNIQSEIESLNDAISDLENAISILKETNK